MRFLLALTTIVASVAAQNSSLTSVLGATPELSSLTALLGNYPDVVTALSAASNITILAPSNDAISKLTNSSSGNSTLGNKALVQAILSYHVLKSAVNSTTITSTPAFVATLLTNATYTNVTGGQRVEAISNNGTVQIISGLLSTSTVTKADISFSGGIIHVIDTILTVPEDIADTAEQFNQSSIVGALTATNLADTVDEAKDITVFAPSNDAFSAIGTLFSNASTVEIASVLKYHVVPGQVLYSPQITNTTLTSLNGAKLNIVVSNGTVYVNQAKVTIPNILVANGVVHVIDSVLNPNNTGIAPGSNSTAFSGASSASNVPFTSGVPGPTGSATVPSVVATTTAKSSTGNFAPHIAMPTGLIGAGAIFAGALMAL